MNASGRRRMDSSEVNPNHGKTITVCGHQYTVEVTIHEDGPDVGKPLYWLSGARGASYGVIRNRQNPLMMFLVHAGRSFGVVRLSSADTVWLTDEGGELREVR
jgi:hypothetical protein